MCAGMAAVVVSLMEIFQHPEWRVFRCSMFAGLGLWGLVPVAHLWILHSDTPQVKLAMMYDLGMGVTYLVGPGPCVMCVL